jgi:hypothetical protein
VSEIAIGTGRERSSESAIGTGRECRTTVGIGPGDVNTRQAKEKPAAHLNFAAELFF